MPDKSTVFRRLLVDQDFSDLYARAREWQADTLADQILDISDTYVKAKKVKVLPDGKRETTIGDAVERAKLRVDARKWVASKLLPKKYGDSSRVQLEHSGDVGIQGLTNEQLAKRLETTLAQIAALGGSVALTGAGAEESPE